MNDTMPRPWTWALVGLGAILFALALAAIVFSWVWSPLSEQQATEQATAGTHEFQEESAATVARMDAIHADLTEIRENLVCIERLVKLGRMEAGSAEPEGPAERRLP